MAGFVRECNFSKEHDDKELEFRVPTLEESRLAQFFEAKASDARPTTRAMTGSRLLWQIPWCILELFMQAGRKIQYIDPQTLQPYSALSRTNAPNLNNLWLSFSGREAPMKQSGLRSRRSLSPEPAVGRYQMMSGG